MRTLLTSFLLLALAATARATVIIPADLGELSRDALAIVRGRVARIDAQWTEDRGTIETIVTLEYRGQRLVARVPGDSPLEPGRPAWVHLPPDRVVMFDASSGQRMDPAPLT